MGISYPDRTNATGVWKLSDIYRNKTTDGTYPGSSGHIALCGGGREPSMSKTVDSFSLVSSGNATDFGDLSVARAAVGNCSSNVRIVFTGGETPSASNVMDYLHFTTAGNASDFGDLGQAQGNTTKGTGSDTKAVTSSGNQDADLLQTFNYTTLGKNSSFGNLSAVRNGAPQGTGDGVRGTYAGGMAPNQVDVIDFVQITTNANAVDFGDLTVARGESSSVDSKTRSVVFAGRTNSPSSGTIINVIDTYQISSLGNAVDFGDMAVATRNLQAGLSDTVRGYCAGGQTPSMTNRIERITISSAGSSTDFGDLSVARDAVSGNTTRHGGLSEFNPRAPELYSPTGKVLPSGGGVGDIGIFAGGNGTSNIIQFITIASTGDAVDFGDKTVGVFSCGGLGSAIRAVFAGGEDPSANVDTIDYVEFRSKGNAADFGNLTAARRALAGLSSDTRGVFGGGREGSVVNKIEYITIASVGNATDFGDLNTSAATTERGSAASTTRGIFAGFNQVPSVVNDIDYITIASTGNASDFGDTTDARYAIAGASSSVRAVFGGGRTGGGSVRNIIDYITIASTGNATDFGDLTDSRYAASAVSNSLRAVFAGGETPYKNVMDFVTIASTGNATDYGDLTASLAGKGPASNGHGGLS